MIALDAHTKVYLARDKIKVLVWYQNSFWLWYRRLEKQRF